MVSVELDNRSFEFAKRLIVQGKINRSNLTWSELKSISNQSNMSNQYDQNHDQNLEYSKEAKDNWFLAREINEENKTDEPILLMGNYSQIYLSAIKDIISVAKENGWENILEAAEKLLELIEDGN